MSRRKRLRVLRELGADKGIEIGSAFSGHSSEAYRQLLATHCDVIAPEWQLKPRHLQAKRGSAFNFSDADEVADFCRTRQLKLHGHTLFWNEEPLRWAERSDWSDVKQFYGTFLATVVSRYPQAISWDVFNEIVDEQTVLRPDFLIGRYGFSSSTTAFVSSTNRPQRPPFV